MSDKRNLLVDTALRLFYDHGVNNVGINEVLKVAGVAKKTLYHHFSSKEALVLATLEARDQRFLSWLDGCLSGQTDDAAVVQALFHALDDWFHDRVTELDTFRGCFFINTSAELGEKDSRIAEYCAAHKRHVRVLIRNRLECRDAQWLDLLFLLKEGAIVSAHIGAERDAALRCIPLALTHLRHLRH